MKWRGRSFPPSMLRPGKDSVAVRPTPGSVPGDAGPILSIRATPSRATAAQLHGVTGQLVGPGTSTQQPLRPRAADGDPLFPTPRGFWIRRLNRVSSSSSRQQQQQLQPPPHRLRRRSRHKALSPFKRCCGPFQRDCSPVSCVIDGPRPRVQTDRRLPS